MVFRFTDDFSSQLDAHKATEAIRKTSGPQGTEDFGPVIGQTQSVRNPSLDYLSGLTSGQAQQIAAPSFPRPQGVEDFAPIPGVDVPTNQQIQVQRLQQFLQQMKQPVQTAFPFLGQKQGFDFNAPPGAEMSTPSQFPGGAYLQPPPTFDVSQFQGTPGQTVSQGFRPGPAGLGEQFPIDQTFGPEGYLGKPRDPVQPGVSPWASKIGPTFGKGMDILDTFSETAVFDVGRPIITSPQILLEQIPGLRPSEYGGQSTLSRTKDDLGSFSQLVQDPGDYINTQSSDFRERPFAAQLAASFVDPFLAAGLVKGGVSAGRQAPDALRAAGRAVDAADAAVATRLTPGLSPELGAGPFPRPDIPAAGDLAQQAPFAPVGGGVPRVTPAQKLTEAIRAAPGLRTSTEAARTRELGIRAGKAQAIFGQGAGETGFQRGKAQFGGALPTEDFEAVRPLLNTGEIDELFDIASSAFRHDVFKQLNTQEALVKVLDGSLPTRSEISLLREAFGKEFADAILSQRSKGRKFWEGIVDASGLPRALKTSFDLSFPFRQGLTLSNRGGWWKAWGPQIKAMRSKKYALEMNDILRGGRETRALAEAGDEVAIKALEKAQRAEKHGLDLIDLEGDLGNRAEEFQTTLAEKIPGVAGSERAFVTFGNKLRRDVFDAFASKVDESVAKGARTQAQADEELDAMADWINIATGRGSLSKKASQDKLMVLGNRLFFSPRLNISRFQAIDRAQSVITGRALTPSIAGGFGKKVPLGVRKEIARDIASTLAAGTAALAMIEVSGLGTVELDPRSSDFAKGRLGPLRYDPWAGFQQVARYATQFVTAQRKATSSGEVAPEDRVNVLGRFFRSKLDPGIPALVVDMITGETFVGEDFDPGLLNQLNERFMPLSIDEMWEAFDEEGLSGVTKSLPSIVGVGVSSFRTTGEELAVIGDTVAQERFGKPFAELDDLDKAEVRTDPRYQERVAQIPDEPLDIRTQTKADFDSYTDQKKALETDMRGKLDAGLDGRDLRNAIGEFKEDSAKAWDSHISPEVQAEFGNDPQTTNDLWRDRYWSTQVTESIVDGDTVLDFDGQEVQRATILKQAKAAGADVNYVTKRSETRFTDLVVKAAVEELEAEQGVIRESKWWDIPDNIAAQAASSLGKPSMTAAEFVEQVGEIVKESLPDADAATLEYAKDQALARFYEAVGNQKTAFMVENPDITKLLAKWEYVGPTSKARLGAILAAQ